MRKQELQREIESLKENIKLLDLQHENANNEKFEAEKKYENKQGSLKLLEERKENYSKERERLERETLELEAQIDGLNKEEAVILEERSGIEEELEVRRKRLEDINKKFEDVNQNYLAYEEQVENKKSEAIELLKNISDLNNKVNTLKVMFDNLNSRKKQLERDENIKKETVENLNNEIKKYQDIIDENSSKLERIKQEHLKISSRIASLEEEGKNLTAGRNAAFDALKTTEARYNTLNDMERDMEGFNRAVKSVISSYGSDKRVYGVVSDLITVPRGFEMAIEIALGPAIQNIVVDNEGTAGMLIDLLKKNKQGRATFLPLSTIKARPYNLNREVKNAEGYLGVASEIIKFDDRFKNIFSNLLGRVLICDNLVNAGAIARKIEYSCRIVTLDGDVINTGGSYTGGSINSKGSGIFSRKNEIGELLKLLQSERDKLTDIENSMGINLGEINTNRKAQAAISSEIQSITVDLQTEQNRVAVLKNQLASYMDEIKDIEIEALHISRQLEENEKYSRNNIEELDRINLIHERISREIEVLQNDQREQQNEKERIWEQITEEKILYAEINKSLEAIDNKLLKLNSERSNYSSKIVHYRKDIEDNGLKALEVSEAILENSREMLQIQDDIECIKNKVLDIYEQIKMQTENTEYREKLLRETDEEINSIITSIHKYEITTSKLEAETEMHVARLWEEYELSIPQAVKYRIELDNMTEANKRLNMIKASIRELGDVNVNSIEEYKKVTERYNFLRTQREDLISAEEALLEMINEITRKMELQFIQGFRIIREHFGETFKALFGGGYADLRLEGADVLSTGIEIIVQPPGKKLQNLSLLSGGERGLAAIALVFAILKMKPTPFCVLDEIEAALDDANVGRFAKFLREYSNNTQFIMITHRKGSMAVADALYGVTMEEKGVSKMISLRLKEELKNGLA